MPLISLTELANDIESGCKLAIAKDETGAAIAATVALIQAGITDLHLVCLPISGLQADLLIGLGRVKTLETSAVTLGEYGAAPAFVNAVKTGSINLIDGTCPAIFAGMQASEKGLPFMPLRGILGSELLQHRTDWKIIDNPFEADDPIVAIKAIDPDVAMFHAQAADRHGNVFVGRQRDAMLLAHAAKRSYATVERIVDGDLIDDPAMAGAVIPSIYLDGVAHVPHGTWPVNFGDIHAVDDSTMRDYLALAREPDAAQRWIDSASNDAPWASLLEKTAIENA